MIENSGPTDPLPLETRLSEAEVRFAVRDGVIENAVL